MQSKWKWVAVAATLGMGAAMAQGIEISDAWVRATVGGQKATGAFMNIKADQDMRLVGVSASVAGVSQVHEMRMQDDVMRMSEMKQGLPLPAGQTVALKPGGYHLMLMDLKSTPQVGQTVSLVLSFQDGAGKTQTQEISAPVKPLSMGKPMSGHDMGKHGNMQH
jgi:periplasmic copper chaperone A